MTSEPLDLVCFYADIGRPYLPLIRTMTESAREVMPDCRLILLTPTPSEELCGLFDSHVWLKIDTTWQSICYDKVRSIITWQAQLTRPCVFIDPDLEFKRPIQFPDDADVGLLWRHKTAHPINTGMILARPGSPNFWKRYGNVAASLPKALHSWWCDQIAFAIMFGSLHKPGDMVQAYDARTKLLPYHETCCQPEHANDSTWAWHFKGIRKGNGWEPYFTAPGQKLSSVRA